MGKRMVLSRDSLGMFHVVQRTRRPVDPHILVRYSAQILDIVIDIRITISSFLQKATRPYLLSGIVTI